MPKLLIIDDEPNIRFSIQEVFEGDEIRVLTAATADDGLRIASGVEVPDVWSFLLGRAPRRSFRPGCL